METNNIEILRFLDKLYKDLYKSSDVTHYSNGNDTDKFGNLKKYLEAEEFTHNLVSKSGKCINLLKQFYYDKYLIKENDIPESIYKLEEDLAFQRGYGRIKLNEKQRIEKRNIIINDQKASLDIWIDYFLSNDSKEYPFWLKYWAFQGMLKIGKYNKETRKYTRRTKSTTTPFIDLNREALSISMDLILKHLKKETIADDELSILVSSGSFAKIYTYIISRVLTNSKNIIKKNQGIWIKYAKGSDHMPLVKSLQGYNTGWCTAGESTAKQQLSKGDFYVFYTLDSNDEYKIPRVAIRMEGEYIGEVRGVAKNQNLEDEMREIVNEKLKEFPNKDKFSKKINDMKMLTHIYKKEKNHEELTINELKFLYEIDYKISGFGFSDDPRITEIKKERNILEDLNTIFSVVHDIEGNLDLWHLTSPEGLVLPSSIGGSLDLRGLKSTEGLVLPHTIGGFLNLWNVDECNGLKLPQNMGGGVFLLKKTDINGLIFPEKLTYTIYLKGFNINPENINLYIKNTNKVKKKIKRKEA